MKEDNEPEELRGAGYFALPVRRRAPDYRAARHLAVLLEGNRASVLRKSARFIAKVWSLTRARMTRRLTSGGE